MAVNYSIPPWLRPADTTGAYAKGYGLGQQGAEAAARVAEAQARLQHDANRAQVEVALKQQSIERDSMIQQQKLEVAKAYHDEQTALKKQQLDEVQQRIDQASKVAAQKFAAQQAINSDFKYMMDQNPDMKPEDAMMRAYMNHVSDMGSNPGQVASLGTAMSKASRPAFAPGDIQGFSVLDPSSKAPIPGMVGFPNASGTGMDVRNTRTGSQEKDLSLPQIAAAINAVGQNKKLMGTNFESAAQTLSQMFKAKTDAIAKKNTPEATDYPVLNKDSKPEKGQLWQTPKGLLYYDGKNFILPRSKGMEDTTVAENDDATYDTEIADTETAPEEVNV